MKNKKSNNNANRVFLLSAILLISLIGIYIGINQINKRFTKFDASYYKIYDLTKETREVLDKIEEKTTMYVLSEPGKEDKVLLTMVEMYVGYSNNINIEFINPVQNPQFLQDYGLSLRQGSVVVESNGKHKGIELADVYVEVDDTSLNYTSYRVKMERLITNAIEYVSATNNPKAYVLVDNELSALDKGIATGIIENNIDVENLNLSDTKAIPEDTDILILNRVINDLTDDELSLILDFVEDGGNIFVVLTSSRKPETKTPNFDQLLMKYGLKVNNGVVLDTKASYLETTELPVYIMPLMTDHVITKDMKLNETKTRLYLPDSIEIINVPASVSVEVLMTSEGTSYYKEKGKNTAQDQKDPTGKFNLSVAATDQISDDLVSKAIVVSGYSITDDTIDEKVSGANLKFVTNAIDWIIDRETKDLIPTKQFSYLNLNIQPETKQSIFWIVVVLIPSSILFVGIYKVLKRRKG